MGGRGTMSRGHHTDSTVTLSRGKLKDLRRVVGNLPKHDFDVVASALGHSDYDLARVNASLVQLSRRQNYLLFVARTERAAQQRST